MAEDTTMVLHSGHPSNSIGVLKSTDDWEHWTQINDGLPPNTDIRSIGMDPSNPSVLYVGTLQEDHRRGEMGANRTTLRAVACLGFSSWCVDQFRRLSPRAA